LSFLRPRARAKPRWLKRFAKLPTFFILSLAQRGRRAAVKLTAKIINFFPIKIFARELELAIF
jgi:hypothetical protein